MTSAVEEVKPVNEKGPEGTYGCACTCRDSHQCAAERQSPHIRCSCLCHGWRDEDARRDQ